MLKGICTTVAAPLLSVVTGTVQDASTGEAVIGADSHTCTYGGKTRVTVFCDRAS